MKVGIIRFLGTNCDYDVMKWMDLCGHQSSWVSYRDNFNSQDYDAIILPGGFSYGDYLRCGALAARSSAVKSLVEFSKLGKPVLGICNGFQILCEANLLPGVLLQNKQQKFINQWSELEVVSKNPFFANNINQKFKLPIAHGDGRFFAEDDQLKKLEDRGQVWIRYVENPNGSTANIAGVMNENKNVAGLMPHPERATHSWMGGLAGMDFL